MAGDMFGESIDELERKFKEDKFNPRWGGCTKDLDFRKEQAEAERLAQEIIKETAPALVKAVKDSIKKSEKLSFANPCDYRKR